MLPLDERRIGSGIGPYLAVLASLKTNVSEKTFPLTYYKINLPFN